MDKAPDVSVLIVSYNGQELLADCLRSVVAETPDLKLEIIVVDNASTDGTVEMVREEFPTVRLIANEHNAGYARACNQMMVLSAGRYVLLLNPDTVILDRSIERVVAFMDANPEVGACGCTIVGPDGEYARSCHPLPTWASGLYDYSNLTARLPELTEWLLPGWIDQPDRTRPVGYCSGAFLLASRACIEDAGPMDEDFFLYGEDVDWCKQIWQSGWPVYFVAEGRVIHYEGGSQSSTLSRRLRELCGRLQYLRKWHGVLYTFVYQVVVYACSLYSYFRLQWRQRHTIDNTENLPEHIAFYRALLAGRYRTTS